MNMTTVHSRYATITGRSSWLIEAMMRRPMPGQAKIVSVTTAKAMTEPNSRPDHRHDRDEDVLEDVDETMRRGDRPLARANLISRAA